MRITPHEDTVSFIFDEAVLVRFKKAGIALLSSNVPTGLALKFHQHDFDLFGYAGLHRVEVVYVLDELEMRPTWIGVIAREARNQLWNIQLGFSGLLESPQLLLPLRVRPEAPAADNVIALSRSETSEEAESEE